MCKPYEFKYHEIMLERILKSPYILNNEKKEKDILKLILKGKNCVQIADIVGYSERTIQNRRKSIYEKTLQYMIEEDKETTYNVYILLFPNKKCYIGMAKEPKKRWNNGEGYKQNKTMYDDIKKFGWDNIEKKILYKDLTFEEAHIKETETIVNYKSYLSEYGYNKLITN